MTADHDIDSHGPARMDDSDEARATRLGALARGSCHYIRERKRFRLWNEKRQIWEEDFTGSKIMRLTTLVTAELMEEAGWYFRAAAQCPNDEERKKYQARGTTLQGEALKTQGLKIKEAMIKLLPAQPDIETSEDTFNAQTDLFAFRNGVYELATGIFREHRREDRLTRYIDRDYSTTALSPRWVQFIGEVWPDPEVQRLMQLWAGYCCSTSVVEQVFLYLWGTGANGKSIWARIMAAMLDVYATQCSIDMFSADNTGKVANRETINLRGKRLAICSETQEGRYFDETLLKSIVSVDNQVGRRLYCEKEEWPPTAKTVILGNHLMRTRGGSHATDRRIRLVGCEQVFDGDKADPNLLDKLMDELPGITRWAFSGYRMWKESGLPVPAKVAMDTADYCAENDKLRAFFEEVTVADGSLEIGRRRLYAAYVEWTRVQGENEHRILGTDSFAARVKDRGFRSGGQKRIDGQRDRVWLGIGLLKDHPSQASQASQPPGKLLSFTPAREGILEKGVTPVTLVTAPAPVASVAPGEEDVF